MNYLIFILLSFVPLSASAAATDFKSFVVILLKLLANTITIFIAALALGILYAVVLYMANSDNEQKRETIKGYLLQAVIGLAVVLGMWGLIELLQATVFGGGFGIPQITPAG